MYFSTGIVNYFSHVCYSKFTCKIPTGNEPPLDFIRHGTRDETKRNYVKFLCTYRREFHDCDMEGDPCELTRPIDDAEYAIDRAEDALNAATYHVRQFIKAARQIKPASHAETSPPAVASVPVENQPSQ